MKKLKDYLTNEEQFNCFIHPTAAGSWFCNTCQKLICNECMTHDHSSHCYVYTEIKLKSILEEVKTSPINNSVIMESKENITQQLIILKKFVESEIKNIHLLFEEAQKDSLKPFYNFLQVIEEDLSNVDNFQNHYSDLVSSLNTLKEQEQGIMKMKITQFKEFIRLTNLKEDKTYIKKISQQSKKIEEEILEYQKKISDSLICLHHFCFHSNDNMQNFRQSIVDQTGKKYFKYNSYFCRIKMPQCPHNFDIPVSLLNILFDSKQVEAELNKLKLTADQDNQSIKRKELINLIGNQESSIVIKYVL